MRRNGRFDSIFGPKTWSYAIYDRTGKRVMKGQAGAGTRAEAEAVAFFAFEHVPGTLVAIAYDRTHWDPPPTQWNHEWQSAAIQGIDDMRVWGHLLGDVAKTMQMPAMHRNASHRRSTRARRPSKIGHR